MKVNTSLNQNNRRLLLEFDVDLPVFPQQTGWSFPFDHRRRRNWLFDRECIIENYASSMGLENQGVTPLEFSRSPYEVYFEFLENLVCVPGFVAIVAADRYSLTIATARLVDPQLTIRRVVQLVQQHFYPDEDNVDMEFHQSISTNARR